MNVLRRFVVGLCCVLLSAGAFDLFSQNEESQSPKKRQKSDNDTIAWHGQFLSLNLVPAARAIFSTSWGVQLQYDCNLFNRFLPLLQFGYAKLDYSRALSSYQAKQFPFEVSTLYRGRGIYGKIGVDVPIARKGPDADNMIFVGARYAAASFSYDMLAVPFWNSYWSNAYTMNFTDEHSVAHWLELAAGLRVKITPSISLGWTIIYKHFFSARATQNTVPPCVPGYGVTTDWVPGMEAWFYWRLPW